ncbi:hypothetical protein A33O_05110 [Nitratireductor aquibiodomus RA22]|uniref:PDZ domain-containing protein n=2 Tax=Nitratireductor aquibiodomus TaxID=204799 RepID=I5C3X5_9HYPH|nr:hypothetical protein A33O_05110 [Nitratireductor aquibiodomus RA22]
MFYVSDVKDGGKASLAGVKSGDALTFITSSLFDMMRPERVGLEEYQRDFLRKVGRHLVFKARIFDLEALNAAAKARGNYGVLNEEENYRIGYFNYIEAERHLGFSLDDRGIVTSVVPGTPAAAAGIQLGDHMIFKDTSPVENREEARTMMIQHLNSVLYNKSNSQYFIRDGETIKLEMPHLAYGETLSPGLVPPELSESELAAFNELPDIIQPVMKALYADKFELADFERQRFYRISYRASIVSFMGENEIAFKLKEALDKKAEEGRFAPLLAHYALVKARYFNNCGAPVSSIDYTVTRSRTYSSTFGVDWTQVLSQEAKSVEVDARFASYVREAEWVYPRAGWTGSFRNFIEKAGGCGSPMLQSLEDNMLRYQSHGS